MLPRDVATAEINDLSGAVVLAEGDAIHVRQACHKRRNEFAAGRLCAAVALNRLGFHTAWVGREAGGAPIWPRGVVGSISHSSDTVLAAVTRSDCAVAIGIDIEEVGAVEPALWPVLFSSIERERLQAAEPDERPKLATSLFAAKEAFYKAQWPVTREWIDFLDVEIEFECRIFRVHPRSPKAWVDQLGAPPKGAVAFTRNKIIAALLVVEEES